MTSAVCPRNRTQTISMIGTEWLANFAITSSRVKKIRPVQSRPMPRSRSARASSAMLVDPSVGGATAGDVEGEAGGERVLVRHDEADHRGDLLDLHEARAGNAREHEVDVLLGDLVEDRRLGGGRRDGVHGDV